MTEEADRYWVLHSGGYRRQPDGGEGGPGEARHQEDVLRPTLPQHSQLNECVLRSGFDSECFQSRSRDRRPTLVLPSGRDGGLLPGVDAAHGGGGQGELLETVTRSAPPTWTGTRRLLWTTLVEEKPPRKPELCRTLSCCPLHDYLVKCFSLMSQSSAVSAVVAIYRELAKKRKSTSQISIRLLFNFL